MSASIAAEAVPMERKRIRISSKRQITIPQKYFTDLGLGGEVDCVLVEGAMIIMPPQAQGGEFAEEILSDLIQEGFQGQQLMQEFRRRNRLVRPAIEKMLQEADALAARSLNQYTDRTADIFGRRE